MESVNVDEIDMRFAFKELKNTKSVAEDVKERAKDSIIVSLDLQQNTLTNIKEIEGLDALKSVTSLNLSWNQISQFPKITTFTKLTSLRLEYNAITSIPGDLLGPLVNLEQLYLSSNKQLSSLPDEIGNLTKLIVIKMASCALTSLPRSIHNLTKLQELYLYENKITDISSLMGKSLTSLVNLDLRKNGITQIPSGSFPPNLTNLNLSDNQLTEFPLELLINCPSIHTFDVSYNRITSIPAKLAASLSPNLKHLNLDSNQISTVPIDLLNSPNLEHLDLSYNRIESFPADATSDQIFNANLKTLGIVGNVFESKVGDYKKCFPNSVIKTSMPKDLPSLILPNLYLGNYWSAKNRGLLLQRNVTHILTVARDMEPPYPKEFKYHVVSIEDDEEEDIATHFNDCFQFIKEGREKGTVLVHCAAGISRSASVVIGYIMMTEKKPFLEALNFVVSQRPIVCPNSGFRNQLTKFEKTLNGKTEEKKKDEKCIIA